MTALPHQPLTELRDVFSASRLDAYLARLWSRREYISFVAVSELRNRQMTTVLGNLWHLLNPALSIATYYVIFGLLLNVDRGVDNYILFITVGVLLFADIQRAAMAGAGSILSNRGLLQSLSFPRAMLPVTATITESLATAPGLVVFYGVALLSSEPARWTWVLLPLLLLVQFWMNLGLALFAARAANRFSDLRQLLPFVFRILLYGSGVIFSVDAYAGEKSWAWLFDLNPVYCYLSIGRWMIMGGELDPVWILSGSTWTVGLLLVGFLWFRGAEHSYGRA